MEEGSHGVAHRAHRTGFNWLDISLALSAFVTPIARSAGRRSGDGTRRRVTGVSLVVLAAYVFLALFP